MLPKIVLFLSFLACLGGVTGAAIVPAPKSVALKPTAWQPDPKAGAYLLVSVKNLSSKKIMALYLARIINANQVEMTTELGKYSVDLPVSKTSVLKIPVAKLGMRSDAVRGAKGVQLISTMAANNELVPTSILYADGSFEGAE